MTDHDPAAGRAAAPARGRLDDALWHAGLCAGRPEAQTLILAGEVRVSGETARRPDQPVRAGDELEVRRAPQYVSRGGEKLAPALGVFGVDPSGLVCADIGASTGGFTDVLLQRGAARVYAVDVGRGLLHWRLRQDPRVVVLERVNARRLERLPEVAPLVTVDVSFIGLTAVLPAVVEATGAEQLVVLFKPQFEVPRHLVGAGGVVRDEAAVEAALDTFGEWAEGHDLHVAGRAPAAVRGPAGNQEHLLHLRVRS